MAKRRTPANPAASSAQPLAATAANPSGNIISGTSLGAPVPTTAPAGNTGGNPHLSAVPAASIPWTEPVGVTGLKRPPWRGNVQEEFLQELSGKRGVATYREMRDNDSVVGAVVFAIESLLRAVKWRVDGDNEDGREFVEQCLGDMRPNFSLTINEILSMMIYGWSVHEVIYKVRSGQTGDPLASSQYDDGRLGWQGWPIRSQDSLAGWDWDSRGQVVNMLQQAPPYYAQTVIPLNRCLHFTTSVHKSNPEGRSMLRSAYRAWWFRRNIQTIEAIGIERDLAGLPMIERAEEFASLDDMFRRILRNVRQDEQSGLIMPKVLDANGNDMIKFTLLSSGGTKQFDTSAVLERYGREIAMVMLADFIMLGHEAVGSFALSSSKTEMFARALQAILETIKAVINEEAIPRLFAVNGMPLVDLPHIEYGDIETPDLTELGDYITKLAGAGCPLFPDPNLEDYLRKAANLPEKSEDAVMMQDEERTHQAEMQRANLEAMRVKIGGGPAGGGNSGGGNSGGGDTNEGGDDAADNEA